MISYSLPGIEAGFGTREAFPVDPARDTKPRMIEPLRNMPPRGR
ncbi:hypothetical protein U1737_19040 [Sphingomonas sp. LB3N6]